MIGAAGSKCNQSFHVLTPLSDNGNERRGCESVYELLQLLCHAQNSTYFDL